MKKQEIRVNREKWDKMEEECGVLAVYSGKVRDDMVRIAYYGLYALQHRGQESAGITLCDSVTEGRIRHKTIKNMGLVSDVLKEKDMSSYVGNILIGHIRYSTTGVSEVENCHPLRGNSAMGKISLAHNGNLINIREIKRELMEEGSLFQTTTDTEIILKLLGRNARHGYRQALLNTLEKIEGAFALVIIIGNKLIGVRDPQGIRPLCLGRTADGLYILASESCALDTLGGEFVRDIEPGEMIIIDNGMIESVKYRENAVKAPCSFEYIYFARPDSIIDGMDVYSVRHKAGKALYRQNPIEADLVIGVPDSGIPAAIGFSEASGIPYGTALVKNKYIGRTFISPSQEMRERAVKVKLNPMKSLIEGKRVVVVDDSLVRGTTSRILIKILYESGAKEVHFRSASPVVKSECYFGVDIAGKKELIGSFMEVDEIREEIGATTLEYLTLDNLRKILKGNEFCMGCFTGEYPLVNREIQE